MDNLSNLVIPKFLDAAITPIAKEAGDRLADVVNLVFTPLYMARKYKDIKMYSFFEKIEQNLKKIPEENIVNPPLSVVGPALEYVAKFGYDEEYLQKYFANLITGAMDKDISPNIHPAFVEIIKQLSKNDALLLNYYFTHEIRNRNDSSFQVANYMFYNIYIIAKEIKICYTFIPHKFRPYNLTLNEMLFSFKNMERLNLVKFSEGRILRSKEEAKEIIKTFGDENFADAPGLYKDIKETETVKRKYISLTGFGSSFAYCVLDR